MQLSHLEVLEVSPCEVPTGCPPGTWPCANCGVDHPVQGNWVVSFRAEPFREVRKTLVCQTCADDLRRAARHTRRDARRDAAAANRREAIERFRDRLRR